MCKVLLDEVSDGVQHLKNCLYRSILVPSDFPNSRPDGYHSSYSRIYTPTPQEELNKFLCRLFTCLQALTVVPLEAGLDVAVIPLRMIEQLACTLINLLGALFSKYCTMEDALSSAKRLFHSIRNLPIRVILTPLTAAYQFFHILHNPDCASPFYSHS